jgi:hypothetical protein
VKSDFGKKEEKNNEEQGAEKYSHAWFRRKFVYLSAVHATHLPRSSAEQLEQKKAALLCEGQTGLATNNTTGSPF